MNNNIRHVKIENKDTGIYVLNRITGVIFSLIEIVLAFRLVFKLFGANPGNGFVNAIYAITAPAVRIFAGIFDHVILGGDAPERVLEPETIIAIIIVAIIAWFIHSLIYPRIRNRTERTEHIAPGFSDDKKPNP